MKPNVSTLALHSDIFNGAEIFLTQKNPKHILGIKLFQENSALCFQFGCKSLRSGEEREQSRVREEQSSSNLNY